MGNSLDTFNLILKFFNICVDTFPNFPPISKNTVVSKAANGILMKKKHGKGKYIGSAQHNAHIKLPLNQWIAHYTFTFVLLEALAGLQGKPSVHSISPKKCLNTFVHSALVTRRQRDDNLNSSVAGLTIKLLAKSSYGHQIKDCS